jgi:MYXO-CTERM domain-containing protein
MQRSRLVAFLSTSLFAPQAQAADHTVKAGGGGDFTTIQACADAAAPGDSCTVFAGSYAETVAPSSSGAQGTPIIFQANSGDSVTVQGFSLGNHSYLVIGGPAANQGFEITGGNITMSTPDHVVIQNNHIHDTSGRCIQGNSSSANGASSYVTVLDNVLDYCGQGASQGMLVEGNHWLIDGNTISRVEDGIALYGDHHVLRNNHIGPVHVADVGSTVHPDAVESSCAGDFPLVHMVFENNVVQEWGPDDSNAHTFLLRDTQSCGQTDQIIRFNANIDNGSYFAVIQTNSPNVRIYNNSISRTEQAFGQKEYEDLGFQESSPGGKVINNVLADMTRADGNSFCYWQDSTSTAGFAGHHNLCFNPGFSGTWQSPPSGYAASDLFNQDPLFVDAAADLHPQAGSPVLGAGGPLTTVASSDSGSGTSLVVDDAGFFQDGYGISGVQADWIRVGATDTAQIASIDYATNTLTLATALTRGAGDDVYLYKDSNGTIVLNGANPDIGAYQNGTAGGPGTGGTGGGGGTAGAATGGSAGAATGGAGGSGNAGSGGKSGSGGATSTGGKSGRSSSSDDSGCSCRTETNRSNLAAWLAALIVAAAFARRRRMLGA